MQRPFILFRTRVGLDHLSCLNFSKMLSHPYWILQNALLESDTHSMIFLKSPNNIIDHNIHFSIYIHYNNDSLIWFFSAHLSPKSQIMAIRDIISPELQAMEQSLFLSPINRLSTCLLPCVSASDCSGTCSHCTLNALLIKLCTWINRSSTTVCFSNAFDVLKSNSRSWSHLVFLLWIWNNEILAL